MNNETQITTQQPTTLQQMVTEETERRKIITAFIKEHMAEGTDYGKIHINKTCENKYNCQNKYHFSKDCLFKPGAEKFVSLMKLRVQYHRDAETWEMAGSPAGLFCYICELVNSNGEIVGEGRGAASIQEKGNTNTAIKIAEKRAKLDAVLSTGGLSDFFTQDLEDTSDTEDKPMSVREMGQKVEEAQQTIPTSQEPTENITDPYAGRTIGQLGVELAERIKKGQTDVTFEQHAKMTREEMIAALKNTYTAPVTPPDMTDDRVCSAHEQSVVMKREVSKTKTDKYGNPKEYWCHRKQAGEICFGDGYQ